MVKTGSKKAGAPSNSKKKEERNRICRYCGVFRPQSENTFIPTNQALLSKWIKILGPRFAENIKKTKSNSICLNHIVNRERGADRLPKRMNKDPKFVFNLPLSKKPRTGKYDGVRKCRYCGDARPQPDMTWIPKNPDDLKKWIEILGPEFAENIKNFKSNFICMTHIKNEVRRPCRIPNEIKTLDEDEEEKEKEENEEQIQEEVEDIPAMEVSIEQDQTMDINDLEASAPIPESAEPKVSVVKEVKVGVNSTRRQKNKHSIPSMDEIQQMKPIPNNIIVKSDSGAVETEIGSSSSSEAVNPEDQKFKCRVCGIECIENFMAKTPTESDEMKDWFNLLGDVYLQNIVLNPPPHYICLNHVPDMVEKVSKRNGF